MFESTLPSALTQDVAPPSEKRAPVILEDDHQESSALDDRGEREREIAFQAAPFLWHDKPLAAFAIDREGDWLLHRALVGAPRLGLAMSPASAFTLDACRILWFCSHDPKEWTDRPGTVNYLAKDGVTTLSKVMTAELWAPILEARIRAWSSQNIQPGEQTAAVSLAFDIFNRAHETQVLIKPEPAGKETGSGN